jgi:RNA polymerase sigma-70 factor, ECF subfamily
MNKSTFSDHQLVELIAGDDTEAFKILFDKYYSTLVRILTRYSEDSELIKDWIQDIFIMLWENRAQLQGYQIANFKAYLIVMARNYAMRVLSRKKKAVLVFSRDIEICDVPDNTLCESLDEAELRLMHDAALAKLPQNTQQAYVLNRHKGLTYSKVAEKMGISIKTVEAHISRTIAFLRQELVIYRR